MIIVCGDSFMAPDSQVPGKHFSELIGARSLARPGCSNIDICFQIEEAIKLGADRVIIGTTDNARTELKMTTENISSLSYKNFRNGDYISDTITTLIGKDSDTKNKYNIEQSRRDTIKKYFIDIYDDLLKYKTDKWALGYWYVQLKDRGINYDVLHKDFCIYTYARQYPNEPYCFHTDFATQELAAILLQQQ